jgi:hypothetical protein
VNENLLLLVSIETKEIIHKNFLTYKKHLTKTSIFMEELISMTGHPEWSLNWYFSERKKSVLVNECNYKRLKNGKIVL